MILNIKPSVGNKTADTLTIGDILCKKSDSFYYELLNITQNNIGENYYHFYGFVVKGAMRQYSVDEKGNEHIVQLSIENWWAGDRESFTMLTPSLYFVDAWEETDLLTLTQTDLSVLDEIPAFLEMKAKMDENHHIALQKRVNASISLSAEQRYEALAQMYPEFLQRFPQHIIASYLGITKETLSRVRASSTKK